jgi:hypothetical protein
MSSTTASSTTPRARIGELLGGVGAAGSFTARRIAPADDLDLEVTGLGRLRFPVSRTRAARLCRLARPARYGRGDQTLLDRGVRDTWEIPKSRVRIDKRRWNRTLLPVLDALRADLGLPEGRRLKAELHSMLVYAPGQFFLPHRDSEKADEMVGTLVVTLPGSFKGGALVVEHGGEKATYRGSQKALSFVAFYADCLHEVKPVKDGHRVVLTYNLLLDGGGAADAGATGSTATVDALAPRLREHFETPRPPRRYAREDAPPRKPPARLVYLLDHQYTERGLGWDRLKGSDGARAATLAAAAEQAGCETVLALAEIQETWDCFEPGWDRPRWGRRRSWARDDDEEDWIEDEPPPRDDPDGYELGELIDSSITLERWIDRAGKRAAPVVSDVEDEEVCATTQTSQLEPYAAEYEGYMGNYGNTMDRWYRRAAIVLWPRERAFTVRAEADPSWALAEIQRRLRAGGAGEAREMAASMAPFWRGVAGSDGRPAFFAKALRAAHGVDEPALAASLLEPFQVEALIPARAPAWAALVERYGEAWTRELLSSWSNPSRGWMGPEKRDPLAWLAALPRLCESLRTADGAAGTTAARLLLEDSWRRLAETIAEDRDVTPPRVRDRALAALEGPVLGVLGGAAVAEADGLRDEAVAFLRARENEPLVPSLVQMLRSAAKAGKPGSRAAPALDAVAEHCARRLEARLERRARAPGDWSIVLPPGCGCELCATLGTFLADANAQQLDWPLAKQRRQHVHGRLDAHELPVRHETRRKGSPYTLALTKTKSLFEREARERRAWRADLEWLARRGRSGGPGRRSRPAR